MRQSIKNKSSRKNQQRQKFKVKKDELSQKKRVFNACSRIVTVLEVDDNTNADDFVYRMQNVESKVKFHVLRPERDNTVRILDSTLVSDYIILLFSNEPTIRENTHDLLSLIKIQGISNVIPVIQRFSELDKRTQNEMKKRVVDFMDFNFPGDNKLYVDDQLEAFARHCEQTVPKGIHWRDKYSYMVAENVEFSETSDDKGVLAVHGYVRGATLDPNRLIHIQNYGDFSIEKIKLVHESKSSKDKSEMELDEGTLFVPTSEESLVLTNTPDPMDAEQTWPTEEEIEILQQDTKKLKKVPKGTSSYQAAWFIDNEEEESDTEENENDVEDMQIHEDPNGEYSEDDQEYEEVDPDGEDAEKDSDHDMDHDTDENATAYQKFLDEKSHLEFPDEIDTPQDMPARERFARYRGLKSFRTSPWDPYENLPQEYGKIFQFKNFKKLKNMLLKQATLVDGVSVGSKCIVYIKDVPRNIMDSLPNPFFIFALLPHEHKLSVQHFTFTSVTETPIKSKAWMYTCVGFRKFLIKPIWSTNTRGGTNDVHKYERFVTNEGIGSYLGPIQVTSVPVLSYFVNDMGDIDPKEAEPEHEEGNMKPITVPSKNITFAGHGLSLQPSPTRIIAKRVILSGHPFKIHQRSSVIRFMFFNPTDIEYFRPIQLVTKRGIKGHIKSSVGTKGFMKCVFEKQISANDTVCLYLYKRVHGKWSFVANVV